MGIFLILPTPKAQKVSQPERSKSFNLDLAVFKSSKDKSKPITLAGVSRRAPIECLPSPQPVSYTHLRAHET